MTSIPHPPVITSQSDLCHLWRQLMEPLGFSEHSIWLMFIGADDRPLSPLTQIDEAVDPPDRQGVESFASLLRHFTDVDEQSGRQTRVALLRSRPGPGPATSDDRAWAARLLVACRLAGIPAEVVHLATDDTVMPLPWDELPERELLWSA